LIPGTGFNVAAVVRALGGPLKPVPGIKTQPTG